MVNEQNQDLRRNLHASHKVFDKLCEFIAECWLYHYQATSWGLFGSSPAYRASGQRARNGVDTRRFVFSIIAMRSHQSTATMRSKERHIRHLQQALTIKEKSISTIESLLQDSDARVRETEGQLLYAVNVIKQLQAKWQLPGRYENYMSQCGQYLDDHYFQFTSSTRSIDAYCSVNNYITRPTLNKYAPFIWGS